METGLRNKIAAIGQLAAYGGGWVVSLSFGALAVIFSTSQLAYSEIAPVDGQHAGKVRWQSYLSARPVDASAELEEVFPAPDPVTTGSVNAESESDKTSRHVNATKYGTPDALPDEQRINRKQKTRRVISTTPISPPKSFTAGSVYERTSFLDTPSTDQNPHMAFVKPDIMGREVEIAMAFHHPVENDVKAKMPVMLAELVNNDNYDVLATAYAPTEPDYVRNSPFASILNTEEEQGRFLPPILKHDHSWAGTALPENIFSAGEQQCLASGIYFEARGEPVKGQAAVAQVILNRVRNPAYPDTACGVVYQNERWRNRCQFSFACDGIRDRIRSKTHWEMAQDVAMAVTAGKIWLEEVGSATHYHAVYVRPKWARTMKKVGRIGLHIFYRTYGGGWS